MWALEEAVVAVQCNSDCVVFTLTYFVGHSEFENGVFVISCFQLLIWS